MSDPLPLAGQQQLGDMDELDKHQHENGQRQHNQETPWLPLFIAMQGEPCLVVGAGHVAARKAASLLKAGCRLTVVAPQCGEAMQALRDAHAISFYARAYTPADLDGQRLVIAASNDAAVNRDIAAAAKQLNILVNVAEPGDASNAVIPASIERLPLQIAVFSGGTTPALMRQLQRQLEAFIPRGYGVLAAFAGGLRNYLRQNVPVSRQRQVFWRDFLAGPLAEGLLAGDKMQALAPEDDIDGQIKRMGQIEQMDQVKQLLEQPRRQGQVEIATILTADPEWLPIKLLRRMQLAEVVVHDEQIPNAVLALVADDIPHMSSENVLPLLIEQAGLGKRVLYMCFGLKHAGLKQTELKHSALNQAGLAQTEPSNADMEHAHVSPQHDMLSALKLAGVACVLLEDTSA